MLIRHLYGPKVGQRLRPDLPLGVEDLKPEIAIPLIGGGFAEEIKYKNYIERLASLSKMNQAAEVPATVQWACVKGAFSERYHISAKCSRANCTSLAYDAPPSASLESITFYHSCGGFAPEKIPAAICDQYRKLFQQPALVGADMVNYYANCQKSKGDGERVDLYAPQTINGVVVGPPVLFDHPVNAKFNNYGHENFQPNPGDGQPVDHSKLRIQFEQGKK